MNRGCHHTMPNGRRCHAIPLRGMAYCYYHQKLHKRMNASKYAHPRLELPSIETRTGVQSAIEVVFAALGKARLDERQARVFMHGLQIAGSLASKTAAPVLSVPAPSAPVQEELKTES
jgi:hypothetical protein